MGSMEFRNRLAVRKDYSGRAMIIDSGNITVTVAKVSDVHLMEQWGWALDCYSPRAVWRKWHPVSQGFTIGHNVVGPLGIVLQLDFDRFHVERFSPEIEDHLYIGMARRFRHGVSNILAAWDNAGICVPPDPVPAPIPEPPPPTLPKPGAVVLYHGSLPQLRGAMARAYRCNCEEIECKGYRLEPLRTDLETAIHVRRSSFTEQEGR